YTVCRYCTCLVFLYEATGQSILFFPSATLFRSVVLEIEITPHGEELGLLAVGRESDGKVKNVRRRYDTITRGDTSPERKPARAQDRKSTRLNSSHVKISYAVFALKKKQL